MRWPNPIIVCTTALALVLAGCDVNIEATDLSAVTIENDRAVIEKALGKPDEVVEAQGFTVAAYTYEKRSYHVQVVLTDRSILLQNPLTRRIEALKSRPPKGRLAAVYDADEKLVFAGSLSKANTTSEKLASIVIRYKATQTGDADALISLSEIAFIPKQQRTFLKTAANSGSAEAQHRLASLVTEDADKIGWLRKAAAQDHTQAQIDLGTALLYAPDDLVDRTEAKGWLTKAVKAGNSDAHTELAKLSKFETYLAGSERGEPDAQFALGDAYAKGKAVKRDQTQALYWWHKAATSGHPIAQLKLVKIYQSGDGVPVDLATANDWAQKAAEHDDPETLLQLAKIYRYGPGSESKMLEAVKMYERAAALGDRSALYDLGTIYKNGEGILRDDVQAYMWLSLAASKNDQTADYGRSSVAKGMSPAQIAEAERMAREWLQAHPQ